MDGRMDGWMEERMEHGVQTRFSKDGFSELVFQKWVSKSGFPK